jgi:hypothetical protein
MPYVTLDDFKRAAADIAAHGDNDTLPFDADDRFIAGSQDAVAQLALNYSEELEKLSKKGAKNEVESLTVFSERLKDPTSCAIRLSNSHLHSVGYRQAGLYRLLAKLEGSACVHT